jgi:hypothetical protein
VAYGFEAEVSLVWLEGVSEAAAETVNAGVLCRRHADALRAPRGWFLDDRRELRPRLFQAGSRERAPDATPPDTLTARPARRRRPRVLDTTEELPMFGATDAVVDIAPVAPVPVELVPAGPGPVGPVPVGSVPVGSVPVDDAPHPDETQALPWVPVFDSADDLGGLLDARSPLLSRAFGRRPPSPPKPDQH